MVNAGWTGPRYSWVLQTTGPSRTGLLQAGMATSGQSGRARIKLGRSQHLGPTKIGAVRVVPGSRMSECSESYSS